jgi:hypothetical protein
VYNHSSEMELDKHLLDWWGIPNTKMIPIPRQAAHKLTTIGVHSTIRYLGHEITSKWT